MQADKSLQLEDFLRITNFLRQILTCSASTTHPLDYHKLSRADSRSRDGDKSDSLQHLSAHTTDKVIITFLSASAAFLLLLWKKYDEMCRWHSLVMSQRSRKVGFLEICALSHFSPRLLCFASIFNVALEYRKPVFVFLSLASLSLQVWLMGPTYGKEVHEERKERRGFFCVQNSLVDIDLRDVDGLTVSVESFLEPEGENC